MATRGTAIIIENDNTVTAGPEFNGDMYPHGHGDYFMNQLLHVTNLNEFNNFNRAFNFGNFDYDESSLRNETYTLDELKNDKNVVSMEYIYNRVTSDWVFVKNLMNKSVRIEVLEEYNNTRRNILVRPGEVVRVNFGILLNNGNGHRIKAPK